MVKVHVWLPDTEHVGHTSLSLKNVYVSFWPEGGAGKKDLKLKRSQPGLLIQSLREDIRNAGNHSRLGKVLGVGIWTPDQVLRFARELQSV